MTEPYAVVGQQTILRGDAWALAETLAPASVDCLVTSPPYWGLRDYGVPGQFGLEKHPQEWIDKLVDLFVRLRPALKRTATLWVNLGDTYGGDSFRARTSAEAWVKDNAEHNTGNRRSAAAQGWYRRKGLLGLPERFMVAMQDAGFLLRNKITWGKPNAMPSSARDRLSCKTETVFFFTTAERYYFDLEAIREPHQEESLRRAKGTFNPKIAEADPLWLQAHSGLVGSAEHFCAEGGKNPGDFWLIATAPFPEAHFATFPPKLIERPLKAGCPREVCVQCGKPKVRETKPSEDYAARLGRSWHDHSNDGQQGAGQKRGPSCSAERETVAWNPTCDCGAGFEPGLVLDPFLGSGTTLCVAKELGLRGIGFELSEAYCRMAEKRIADWQRPKDVVKAEEAGQTVFDFQEASRV